MSTAATAASSLLAAQWSGVSPFSSSSPRESTSAPAPMSNRAASGAFGKKPGQSVTTCRGVRPPPGPPRRAVARPGCSSTRRWSASRSPLWTAAMTSMATSAVVIAGSTIQLRTSGGREICAAVGLIVGYAEAHAAIDQASTFSASLLHERVPPSRHGLRVLGVPRLIFRTHAEAVLPLWRHPAKERRPRTLAPAAGFTSAPEPRNAPFLRSSGQRCAEKEHRHPEGHLSHFLIIRADH